MGLLAAPMLRNNQDENVYREHRPPLVGDATTRFEEHKLVILAAILLHKCYLYVALPRYSVSCFEAHNHKKAFRTK
jgi:hypothetical protein